jgi:hypothetical protein
MFKYLIAIAFSSLFSLVLHAQTPLILGVYNKKVSPSETTCVSVYGRNFDRILSMQYTIAWNPQELQFKEIKGFSLSSLSINNFGLNKVKEGFLTFSWYDPQLRGITKADGEQLYEVCFQVNAASGTKSQLQFTNNPTTIEISMGQGILIGLKTEGGKIEVK